MKIGELAQIAGCQTVTIRFYERKGLLNEAARSDANYRQYGQQDVERLAFIRNCRALSLTLREIERLIAIQKDPTLECDEVNDYLDRHLAEVQRQMESLSSLEKQLKRLRKQCLTPRTSMNCGVLSQLSASDTQD
jgi:Cd(II)/Pb(II)-responsive transcriptional regulator